MNSNILFLLFCCITVHVVVANPKKYNGDEGNFQPNNPNNLRYYEANLPNHKKANISAKVDKESRFGIPVTNYGHSGSGVSGYPGGGVGYAPVKIDIGGIAVGALIGLGAILIIPKLAHIFSGGYGYRSLGDDMSSVTELLSRIDNSLEQHNIDSSSCMQRVICSYVYESQKNMESGAANTIDQLVFTLSNNSLLTYMLDGSAIKTAVDMGKSDDPQKCDSLYMKCPVSKENITQIIASLLP